MENSTRIDDLHPIVQGKALRLQRALLDQGVGLIFLSTWRDGEWQAARFAIGRTERGPNVSPARPMGAILTGAAPGYSFHEHRLAFDAWPIVHGRVITSWAEPDYTQVWKLVRRLARDPSINLRHGANVAGESTRREWEHFWYSAALSIEQIRAGERLPDVDV